MLRAAKMQQYNKTPLTFPNDSFCNVELALRG